MMDDLISRQAAIDALISFFGLSIEEEYGSAIQEVLNGLPSAQSERKWIPVAEGLPGYGEDVLLTVVAYCTVGHLSATNDEEKDEWYFSGWYHPMSDVTAWMPLPEPYERRRQ